MSNRKGLPDVTWLTVLENTPENSEAVCERLHRVIPKGEVPIEVRVMGGYLWGWASKSAALLFYDPRSS